MKTALESYMETMTVQEKTKILTEQELCRLQQTNIDTILEYIQNGIDLSIGVGEFQRITRLIETNIYTKYNGVLSGWQLLTAKNNWTDYNVKAGAFYTIPRLGSPILNFESIAQALEKLGYACSIKDSFINEATSKTGRYADSHRVKEITVNWENSLVILTGDGGNG